jgi:hypothetical protein
MAAYSYRIPGAVSSFPISSVRTELWLYMALREQ